MKKFFVLMLAATLILAGQAWAVTVYSHNVTAHAPDTTTPGDNGTKSSDNITVTWSKSALSMPYFSGLNGGFFWIKNVDGDATSVKINFYTSYFKTGDSDWAIFAPMDSTTKKPTNYDLTMPGADKTWLEPFPCPDNGIERIKAVFTFSDSAATDNITIKFIPSSKFW